VVNTERGGNERANPTPATTPRKRIPEPNGGGVAENSEAACSFERKDGTFRRLGPASDIDAHHGHANDHRPRRLTPGEVEVTRLRHRA